MQLKEGHYRSTSETPFKFCFARGSIMPNIECWLGSFKIFQGIRTNIAKKGNGFMNFQRGRVGPPVPSPS